MGPGDILIDGFGRVQQLVEEVLDGLTSDQLRWQPAPGANPVGWLVWHLSRVQDSQVSEVAGAQQVWLADGWAPRLGLPYDPAATGYGQRAEEVGAFRGSGDLLAGYHQAVHQATARFLATVSPDDLDEVVDRRWDPPVTLGVRLVSILSDDLQHVGQAAYLKGLVRAR